MILPLSAFVVPTLPNVAADGDTCLECCQKNHATGNHRNDNNC